MTTNVTYEVGSKRFRPDTQRPRQTENAVRDIYSAIYGEVNVSVSGRYVLQYAEGTRASSCFICHFKNLVRAENVGPYYVNNT